jgi:hypothetical protein
MRSIADSAREDLRRETLELSLEERIEGALRLGEEALALFQQTSGLGRDEAIRELERRRQAGRTPSKCISDMIG